MDDLYEYLKRKYFVDYDDPEVSDMYKAVKGCLGDFQNIFNKCEQCGLKLNEIMPVGSMSEGTTIWLDKYNRRVWKEDKEILYELDVPLPKDYKCIEFDFLAILEPLTPDMETVPTCPGHAKVRSEIVQDQLTIDQLREKSEVGIDADPYDLWEYENIFQKPYTLITREFYQSIMQVVKQLVDEQDCFQREEQTGTCTLEFADTSDATVLFVWVSKLSEKKNKAIVGKMDFLPAFRTTHLPHATYIVGKRCCDPMSIATCSISSSCDSDCKQQCWRVSQSSEETEYIRNTAQHHRDFYRIIKIFCDKVSKHHYLSGQIIEPDFSHCFKIPTSYHIKTALIHHIRECDTNTANITKCFCQTLLLLKQYTDRGQLLNWKGTFYLGIDAYEAYFCSVMWLVFSQFDSDSSISPSGAKEYLYDFNLPENIQNMVSNLMSVIAQGSLSFIDFEPKLGNILVYPVWDYVMSALSLSTDVSAQGNCDIGLEIMAQVYGCISSEQDTDKLETCERIRPVVQRSHSDSDLRYLADYLDDKNFDKNWEDIYLWMRVNNMPDGESFTQHVKSRTQTLKVYDIPSEYNSQLDHDEKELIMSAIQEERDFWFNKMQETFIWFSSTLDTNFE